MRAALDSRVPSQFNSVEEMFSVRQKMDCVQWLTELKSYSCVRRKFNQVCPNRTAQIYLQIRDALGQEAERERKCLVTTRAATQYAVP